MAERERGGAAGRPKASDFIAALVKDPRNPPQVSEVCGYIGGAAETGRIRIYLDTSLQNYFEVAEDKVLHVAEIEGEKLGLSQIFLAADAQIFPPETPQRLEARAAFGGGIYQDYLSAAAVGGTTFGGGGLGQIRPTLSPFCHTLQVYCRSIVQLQCPSVSPAFCHTHSPLICRSLQLAICTWSLRCPTRHPVQCTIHPLICFGVQLPDLGDIPQPYADVGAATGMQAPELAQAQYARGLAAQPFAPSIACPSVLIQCASVFPRFCPPRTLFGPLCPPRTLYGPWCPPRTIVGPWCPPPTLPPRCPPPTWPVLCGGDPFPSRVACSIVCGGGGFDPGDPVGPDWGGGFGGMAGGYGGAYGGYDPYAAYTVG